jgi:CubicO group peptidase (beta-lactamase class C family)
MRLARRFILAGVAGWVALGTAGGASAQNRAAAGIDAIDYAQLKTAVAHAAALPRLHALIVMHAGVPLVSRAFHGPGLDVPVDIKSLSKIVIDTLVGIAIDHGLIRNTRATILPLLRRRAPVRLDSRVGTITIDELLSMRAGLERTSGPNYGRWVNSSNWVRFVLTRPFEDEPGGAMLYSTGNTHLLSAILTDASDSNTWQLARKWLGDPLAIAIPRWTRDPQGIYLGGNEMSLSPRALARIGETWRLGGVYHGRRVVSADWVRRSWTPETTDLWGHGYGYGWFISQADGRPVYFGWGFGGQMLYVVPSLELTVVITSSTGTRSFDGGYLCELHDLLASQIMTAFLPGHPAADASALCGPALSLPLPAQVR